MYEMKGIRRLMAAVLLRAVRDIYASDKVIQYQAAEWLQRSSVEHINRYGLKISQWRFGQWVENGCQLDDLISEYLKQTTNFEIRKKVLKNRR